MSSIMFVLPVGGGSGGAHSVMQEADAMRALGVHAMIAANSANAAKLRRTYRDLKTIQSHVHGYADVQGLAQQIIDLRPDVVVATTNQSVHVLDNALKLGKIKDQRVAYYIQDYEPLFYPEGSNEWNIAYSSYSLIPRATLFAKTHWLQEVVSNNHNVTVSKVEPSIDHKVYFPDLATRDAAREKLTVVAMMRPATPRRAPRRTARIISRIAREFGDRVNCVTFGCAAEELKEHSLRMLGVEHIGLLSREEVGDLFRGTDLFLDLSDFQAFGRTAVEAMSCGSSAVVPAHGGAYEYAKDGKNCFVVDIRSDAHIMAAVQQWIDLSAEDRRTMTMEAVKAGYRYSPERAALSEIELLLG